MKTHYSSGLFTECGRPVTATKGLRQFVILTTTHVGYVDCERCNLSLDRDVDEFEKIRANPYTGRV